MSEAHRPTRSTLADPLRLAALATYGELAAAPEVALESLVRLAAEFCNAPVGLITLVDDARQLFVTSRGYDGAPESPLEVGFCPVVVEAAEPLVIPDTLADAAHATNRAALEGGVRFYAGVPLLTGDNHALGTLCVLDQAPRPAGLTATQLEVLQMLALQVITQFELRRSLARQEQLLAEQRSLIRSREVLARVQTAIFRADGDLDLILKALADGALEATPAAEAAVLELIDGDVLEYRQVAGALHPHKGLRLPLEGSLAGHCVTTNMPALVADAHDDPYVVKSLLETLQLRSAVLAPIARGEQVLGVLKLQSSRADAFSQHELDVVTAFAAAATTGLTEVRAADAQRTAAAGARRLQAIFDSATEVAIVVTDKDGRITDWNAGAERILGWSAGEMRGQTGERIFTPEDQAAGRMATEMSLSLAYGRAADERWHLRKDGGRFWASGEMTPLRSEQGDGIGFVKVLRDRTTEHLALEAMSDSEAQRRATASELRLVADALPLLVAFVDRSETYRFANERYREWFGEPWQEVIGQTIRILAGPEGYAARAAFVRRALDGESVRFDLAWPHLDGRARIADIRYTPRRSVQGDFDGFYIFVQDVTAQRDAEALLAAENVTLSQAVLARTAERNRLWETTNDLMGMAGNDGYLKTVNPAWTALLGWSQDELLARPFMEIIDPADHAETADIMGRLSAGKPVNGFVDHLLSKNGPSRTIMWTAVPEPERAMFYVIGRDLTEQVQAEEALRQSQKMEAVGQLTGGLAHDFNNLLAGITGSLDLMGVRLSQGRVNDVEKYMTAAQGAAKRAAALTHRLLAFSRRQTLDPKPTNINALVGGMTDLIQRTVGPAIQVETVQASGLWPTLVDPPQLENALLNLCINARDAMPDGGKITIETANKWLDRQAAAKQDVPEGQYLSLCVTDTGVGMSPDLVSKIFDPFFTTKPIGQGTGLGLSMIYGFAKQSGGQVRVYSEVGEGTTMCIYLPRHYGEADAHVAQPAGPRPAAVEDGETVLVVDDEPTVRMLVTDVLEDLGYRAIEAADSASGLKVLQSDVRLDLLITDVGLPGGMNGRQMAEAGREARPDLKVLFITGYAENAVLNNGHLSADMQVMTKPFPVESLVSRIRELIDGSGA